MKKREKHWIIASLLLITTNLSLADSDCPNQDIQPLIQFMVSDQLLVANSNAQLSPRSYFVGEQSDIANYFGDFICTIENNCTVIDRIQISPRVLSNSEFNVGPDQRIESDSQIERVTIRYGTDIYHGALWQIALALAAKNGLLNQERASQLIENELEVIRSPSNRAIDSFRYGNNIIVNNPESAFSFRWLSRDWFNQDPFLNSRFQDYITSDFNFSDAAKFDPLHRDPSFYQSAITWSDQKPLLGKNAWAQLIGPLQAELILTNGAISISSLALRNAMVSLPTFSALQAGIGAFYLSPANIQTQGVFSDGEISIEDNFSVLAGLQILKRILLGVEQTPEVILALGYIDIMLYGGTTVNGFETLGLLSFIYNGAFDAKTGLFYSSGVALIPSSINDWQPNLTINSSFAVVRTNLWGIAALGINTINNWFGQNTVANIWQSLRNRGGYYYNQQFWGMGYSLNNNPVPSNSIDSQSENIMSTESTTAAINMLNSFIAFDETQGINSSELQQDLFAMQQHICNLRNDQYINANFNGAIPQEFFIRVPESMGQAYLYASKRFILPFDWNANPLASLSATAWVVINYFQFNPLQYLGGLIGENYPIPPKATISSECNSCAQTQSIESNR